MEERYRILQLSDLLIGGSDPAIEESRLEKLFQVVTQRFERSNIDYIIVCGNITVDGSRQSFEQASTWLVKFAKLSIGSKYSDRLADRLMIAPGQWDLCAGQTDEDLLSNFNEFLLSLRKGLGDSSSSGWRPISNEHPLVKRFKDGTFIVVPYFQHKKFDAELEPLLKVAARDVIELDYCRTAPTFLISAASPGIDWGKRSHLSHGVRSVAEQRLCVNFHLFGASPVIVTPFEPFVYRHIGLATGPREDGDRWPFRANIIEVWSENIKEKSKSGGSPAIRRLYTVEAHMLPENEQWAREFWCKDETLIFDRHPAGLFNYLQAHSSLYDEIKRWLNDDERDRCYCFEDIPGSGVSECFELLRKSRSSLDGWNVRIEPILSEPHLYRPDRYEPLKNKLAEIVEQYTQLLNRGRSNRTLLILDDHSYNEVDSDTTRNWLDLLFKTASSDLNFPKLRILHVVTPRVVANEFRFPRFPFSGVDRSASLKVSSSFSREFPFQPQAVENLTGGALKLKFRLLDQSRFEFKANWAGGDRVDLTSARNLISSARATRALSDSFYETFAAIKRMEPGPALLEAVDTVLECTPDFCQPDLSLALPQLADILEPLADFLVRQGLLSKSSKTYSVRALGPFLVGKEPPEEVKTPALSAPRAVQPLSDMMICYAGPDRDLVDLFLRVFKPRAHDLGIKIWEDSKLASEGAIVPDAIQKALKSVSLAVIFVSTYSILPDHYVTTEELPVLRKREAGGENLFLLTVICEKCDWKRHPNLKDISTGAGGDQTIRDLDDGAKNAQFLRLADYIEELFKLTRANRGNNADN